MKRKKAKREVRRTRHKSAWIVINGSATSECQVLDISKDGAKVVVEVSSSVPDRFALMFFQGGQNRACEVIWRRAKMLGVKFV
jgi:PilZ domain